MSTALVQYFVVAKLKVTFFIKSKLILATSELGLLFIIIHSEHTITLGKTLGLLPTVFGHF